MTLTQDGDASPGLPGPGGLATGETAGRLTRRSVLSGAAAVGVAAGVGALAACGDGGGPGSSAGDVVTVRTDQVPVGGAVIVGAAVVSQPTAGEFRAFSAVCTHEGCLVARVTGDTVECTCHFSTFSVVDGSVLGGPAPRPLPSRTVTAAGDTLTVA
jgi:Rieske Fe-S protein